MVVLSEAMIRMVRGQRLGYVGTVSPEGAPRVSPKGSLAVWDENHLVFADIDPTRTVENLRTNPLIEVNVVDPLLRKGFRFSGKATVLRGGDLYSRILEHYKGEGANIHRVRWLVLMEVTGIDSLVSPAYAAGFSEEEVLRLWEEYYSKRVDKTVIDLVPPTDF